MLEELCTPRLGNCSPSLRRLLRQWAWCWIRDCDSLNCVGALSGSYWLEQCSAVHCTVHVYSCTPTERSTCRATFEGTFVQRHSATHGSTFVLSYGNRYESTKVRKYFESTKVKLTFESTLRTCTFESTTFVQRTRTQWYHINFLINLVRKYESTFVLSKVLSYVLYSTDLRKYESTFVLSKVRKYFRKYFRTILPYEVRKYFRTSVRRYESTVEGAEVRKYESNFEGTRLYFRKQNYYLRKSFEGSVRTEILYESTKVTSKVSCIKQLTVSISVRMKIFPKVHNNIVYSNNLLYNVV